MNWGEVTSAKRGDVLLFEGKSSHLTVEALSSVDDIMENMFIAFEALVMDIHVGPDFKYCDDIKPGDVIDLSFVNVTPKPKMSIVIKSTEYVACEDGVDVYHVPKIIVESVRSSTHYIDASDSEDEN